MRGVGDWVIGCTAAREAAPIAREKERESEWGVIEWPPFKLFIQLSP